MTSPFIFEVQGVTDELRIVELTGREALSSCFRFDLSLVAPSSVDLATLLGAAARLRLRAGSHERTVAGDIERVRRGVLLAEGKQRVLVRLVPRLRRLALRNQSRIFQDASTRDIVTTVLSEHGVTWRSELLRQQTPREYCVQHDETDLELVERLLAEEGIVYRFQPPEPDAPVEAPECVVLFDAASAYVPVQGDGTFVYRPDPADYGAMRREEHHVYRFLGVERAEPATVALRAFDFKRPQQVLTAASPPTTHPQRVVVESHGPYGEMQVEPQPTNVVLDQVRRGAERFRGESGSIRLVPGATFTLADHEVPSLSAEYTVVAVRHEGHDLANDETTYTNRFTTVKKAFLLRPRRPARRVRQSLETAVVTGPAGEEIHTDVHGRIKVQFHWDAEGKHDDRSSCWIRVAQSWAGAGWGAQFIPRIGMEVLVGFLGGDPDRPIVMGALPNATHPPAFPLPENKTRSGIKTRSTPAGPDAGYNELSFEDDAGKEQVRLVAHRDMDMTVRREQRISIGATRSLEIAGDDFKVVRGAQQTRVEGPARVSYGAGGAVEVSGHLSEHIHGSLFRRVEREKDETIEGSSSSTIRGERKSTVTGPWNNHAESIFTLQVGKHDAPGHADIIVRGTLVQSTDDVMVIESKTALRFVCGQSMIELSPEGIAIHAEKIALKARGGVIAEGDGPALRLTDRAEVVADEVKLRGKQSSLELVDDATIKGAKVYLNCASPQPPKEDENGEATTKPLKLVLNDEMFKPYAAKHYELRAAGFTAEGTTGAQGEIEHDVPAEARVAQIEVWLEGFPTGPRRTYTVDLKPLEPIDTIPGLRMRLKNLGYFEGPTDVEVVDDALIDSIRAFQQDHELEATGDPDDATLGAVLQRHQS